LRHLGILAGLLLFVAACGGNGDGGDELTLAEYFQRVEAASGDFARRGEDLLQTMEAAGANASSPADLRAPLLDFLMAQAWRSLTSPPRTGPSSPPLPLLKRMTTLSRHWTS
jgi:hypothetical protein